MRFEDFSTRKVPVAKSGHWRTLLWQSHNAVSSRCAGASLATWPSNHPETKQPIQRGPATLCSLQLLCAIGDHVLVTNLTCLRSAQSERIVSRQFAINDSTTWGYACGCWFPAIQLYAEGFSSTAGDLLPLVQCAWGVGVGRDLSNDIQSFGEYLGHIWVPLIDCNVWASLRRR